MTEATVRAWLIIHGVAATIKTDESVPFGSVEYNNAQQIQGVVEYEMVETINKIQSMTNDLQDMENEITRLKAKEAKAND